MKIRTVITNYAVKVKKKPEESRKKGDSSIKNVVMTALTEVTSDFDKATRAAIYGKPACHGNIVASEISGVTFLLSHTERKNEVCL